MAVVQPRPGARTTAFSDLQGAGRLAVAAVVGVTDIVEDMHRNIAGLAPVVGASPSGRARGISGLVYRGVRGVTRAVGFGLDTAFGALTPLLGSAGSSPRREAVLAALNGVFGDYLAASNNPLAITMQLRRNGQPLVLERHALASDFVHPGGKLLVLVHGLCMNDLQWAREGHDHGAALARDLGYAAIYLHYNSGRHIATNGREFAATLERLVQSWPVPITELVIVGHSMGGLVARSACHCAKQAGQPWLRHLKKLVFLGTPHHGAPLERAGNWVDYLLGVSPYTAPFARLGTIRSAGIKDLRHGRFTDEGVDAGKAVPLPARVKCFAVAATKHDAAGGSRGRLPGDGLVPVNSALGKHENVALALPIPASRQAICYGSNHFDLLSSAVVYDRIRGWLATG